MQPIQFYRFGMKDYEVLIAACRHSSYDERRNSLRVLINAAAADLQVPLAEEDLSLLDEHKLHLLIRDDLVTRYILMHTTYEELVAAGVTRGAAKVLKTLFPGPTEG